MGIGGAGVYFGPDDPRNLLVRFNCASSYQCELRAVKEALRIIANEIHAYETEGKSRFVHKYVVVCDHLGLVEQIEVEGQLHSKQGKKLMRLYDEIWDFYNDNRHLFKGHVFEVQWIKGHSGNPGNEAADRLAYEARQGDYY